MNKSKEDLLIDYSKSNNIYGVAELLLTHPNINVNHAGKRYGYTALIEASERGKIKCVELLLKHPNINVNHAGKRHGETALMYASEKGHTKCIELLLKHPNINPLQQDIYGTCYFDDVITHFDSDSEEEVSEEEVFMFQEDDSICSFCGVSH